VDLRAGFLVIGSGIAAALGPDDSPALHARDTTAAGDGLCVPAAVDRLVRDGPGCVRELLDWGAAFDRDADGRPSLGREAAHSVRRILHARDATGREIARLLWARVSASARIRVVDEAAATALLIDDGCCVGARFVTAAGVAGTVAAAQTPLATGGAGQIFRETTNPAVATGDGIAMAARAGARVAGGMARRAGGAAPAGEPRRPFRADFPARDDLHWGRRISDRLWA